MSGDSAEKPKESTAEIRRVERRERLARALRENLKKRKDQARGRAARADGDKGA